MRLDACAVCSKKLSKKLKRYCGKGCLSIAYKTRLIGDANPNYKKAGIKKCNKCGSEYLSYNKKSLYCSRKCSPRCQPEILREMSHRPRKKRIRLGRRLSCKYCVREFRHPIKTTYCSYECRKNGMRITRHATRKDKNHNEIVCALRAVGASVLDMSNMGGGVPDILVGRLGIDYFMEIKNPTNSYGKAGLTASQKDFAVGWKGSQVLCVRSVQEALAAIGVFTVE